MMFLSTAPNGKKVIYNVPSEIKTKEELNSLIYGYHSSKYTREELQGMPKLLCLAGPMFNGFITLPGSGKEVPVILYEKWERGERK